MHLHSLLPDVAVIEMFSHSDGTRLLITVIMVKLFFFESPSSKLDNRNSVFLFPTIRVQKIISCSLKSQFLQFRKSLILSMTHPSASCEVDGLRVTSFIRSLIQSHVSVVEIRNDGIDWEEKDVKQMDTKKRN